jgi:hypothetical protein
MSSSQNNLDIITMLNNMYNNNTLIMERLVSSNNEIIRTIQNVLNINQHQTQNQNQNSRRTQSQRQRQTQVQTLPVFVERSLLNNPPLYSNSFVLDYQDSISTDQITELLQTFMSPIVVRPSQLEIENSTSLIRFSEIVNPLNNSCPISLEPFIQDEAVTMIKYCGHIFKTCEIQHWFETNVRCPVCRYDIRTFRNNNNNSNSNSNRTSYNTNTNISNNYNQENSETQNNNTRREERINNNRRSNLTSRNNNNNPRVNSNENNRSTLIDNFLLNFTTVSDVSYNNFTL